MTSPRPPPAAPARFDAAWLKAVQNIDSSHLSADAAADRNRLSETIESALKDLAQQDQVQGEIAPLVPSHRN